MQPLLLHACCAPCSIEPIRLLRAEGYEPTICWTNPNIQPVAEHERRLETMRDWAEACGCALIEGADDRELWERYAAPHGFDRPARCRACYALRLAETCRIAERAGFTYVSTTLVVSPYQLFDVCHDVYARLCDAHGLELVWRDFRPWYPQATVRSREEGMYRQNYCGCRFSALEATQSRQRARDERKAARAEGRPVNVEVFCG